MGTPTTPRMLYAGAGWIPIHIEAGEKPISFDFTAIDTEKNAQMNFHFDPLPANVVLDDIHVTDLADNSDVVPLSTFENPADFGHDVEGGSRQQHQPVRQRATAARRGQQTVPPAFNLR